MNVRGVIRPHVLVSLLVAVACGPRVDRQSELATCQLISKSGQDLATCLIMKYDWKADSAGPAKTAFQWQLDSIRREHDEQAQAVYLAQLQQQADSLTRVFFAAAQEGLGNAGYDSATIRRTMAGVRRRGRQPATAEVVGDYLVTIASLFQMGYDTMPDCKLAVTNLLVAHHDPTQAGIREAQRIVCRR